MLHAFLSRRRRRRPIARLAAAMLAVTAMAPAAHATGFIETGDFSDNAAHPTLLGTLTPGLNFLTGMNNSYGPRVGPHGERLVQDQDFVTFTVPTGYVLSQFLVNSGTSILTSPRADNIFLGLAAGDHVSVDPSFTSAAGLIGWTLVSQAQVGSDILSVIGSPIAADGTPRFADFPVRGATGFTAPLGAGTYTLWLYDGDEAASYGFDLVTSAVPEAASWAMMLAGAGMVGGVLRRRRSAARATAAA